MMIILMLSVKHVCVVCRFLSSAAGLAVNAPSTLAGCRREPATQSGGGKSSSCTTCNLLR
jgi:hypothetical protein